jgi:hypothetical protein
MPDERRRRLARNLAMALVLAGCSLAQYAAVSRAAPFRVVLAGDRSWKVASTGALGTPAASEPRCAERSERTAYAQGGGATYELMGKQIAGLILRYRRR